MSSVARSIPDEASLEVRAEEVWSTERAKILASLQDLQRELEAARPSTRLGLFLILVGVSAFCLLVWPTNLLGNPPPWFVGLFSPGRMLVSAVLAGVLGTVVFWLYRYWQTMQQFVSALNEALHPLLGVVFGTTVEHFFTKSIAQTNLTASVEGVATMHDEVIHHLHHAALFTDTVTYYDTDDVLLLDNNRRPLLLAELRLQLRTGAKHEQIKTLFSGLLIHYQLTQPLTGKTYISTEGDKHGFAHRTFWNTLLRDGTLKETLLESNDFERDLHVATTDPVEARYILTPDFMLHLHEWWLEHRQNIRIVFQDQDFYMLLPDEYVRFNQSPTTLQDKVITQYLFALARPVWRALRLVEDMRK